MDAFLGGKFVLCQSVWVVSLRTMFVYVHWTVVGIEYRTPESRRRRFVGVNPSISYLVAILQRLCESIGTIDWIVTTTGTSFSRCHALLERSQDNWTRNAGILVWRKCVSSLSQQKQQRDDKRVSLVLAFDK